LALAIGTQLGSLEVTELIGRGGMGEVYRARHATIPGRSQRKAFFLVLECKYTGVGTLHGKARNAGQPQPRQSPECPYGKMEPPGSCPVISTSFGSSTGAQYCMTGVGTALGRYVPWWHV